MKSNCELTFNEKVEVAKRLNEGKSSIRKLAREFQTSKIAVGRISKELTFS
jgi:hypothetical protein